MSLNLDLSDYLPLFSFKHSMCYSPLSLLFFINVHIVSGLPSPEVVPVLLSHVPPAVSALPCFLAEDVTGLSYALSV